MVTTEDTLRTRNISFSQKQAEEAMAMLKDVSSIKNVTLCNLKKIAVTYDIRKLSLQMIESALKEVGFSLNNGLLQKIKRALCAYCDDAERERLGLNHDNENQLTPLKLSEKKAQDPRPNDWRHYT